MQRIAVSLLFDIVTVGVSAAALLAGPAACQTLSDLDAVELRATDAGVRDAATDPDGGGSDDGADASCDDVHTYYADEDDDGYGTADSAIAACAAPSGFVSGFGDCDDSDPTVNPEAIEVCDQRDNNCDGHVDEDLSVAWFRDDDHDGYGRDNDLVQACARPDGYAELGGDCDDTDPAYNPGADERDCTDPADYNCDGSTGYDDADGDGFAACEECNDAAASAHPGADEICDSIDNDCDSEVDEDDAVDATVWYLDNDGDSFGVPGSGAASCIAPPHSAERGDDCDDGNAEANPNALEICDDGIDNDCDSDTDADDSSCQVAPDLTCPSFVSVGLFAVAHLGVQVESTGEAEVEWTLLEKPTASLVEIDHTGGDTLEFAPDQRGSYTVSVTATNAYGETSCTIGMQYDGPLDCEDGLDSDVDGTVDEDRALCTAAPIASCPASLASEVDAPIDVGATATGDIVRTERFVTGAPVGFPLAARPKIDSDDGVAPLVGTYEVMMIFTASDGQQGACTTELLVETSDLLHVELIWNPTVPAGTDSANLDLHLLHDGAPGWFDDALDCDNTNCLATDPDLNWGDTTVTTDDPLLHRSTRSSPGPESISIAEPEMDVPYRVGVATFSDGGQGPAVATVRIYCGGVLATETGPAGLSGPLPGQASNDFWRAAEVTFPSTASSTECDATLLVGADASYDITTVTAAQTQP